MIICCVVEMIEIAETIPSEGLWPSFRWTYGPSKQDNNCPDTLEILHNYKDTLISLIRS